MKTILALQGVSNSGKSTTIRLLYDLLLANGYTEISNPINVIQRDFHSIFLKNNKKVGITSYGDSYEQIRRRLQRFSDENCYVCVCACRASQETPTGTIGAVTEFTNYRQRFVLKTVVRGGNQEEENRANNDDSKRLLNEIEILIR